MLRKIVFVMMFVLVLAVMIGRTQKGETVVEESDDFPPVLYDTGLFCVEIPAGWAALEITNPFAKDSEAIRKDCLFVIKGGSTEADLHTRLYLRLEYYGPETSFEQPKENDGEKVQFVEPFEAGKYTWNGFACEEYQGRVYLGKGMCLWSQEAEHQFVVAGFLEREGQVLVIEDDDVQQILASLDPCTP